ncbi:hypothetical protein M758_4G184600 [Ceratodon purpureus]|nr:hypothetical protein M758_4G184600 [Ceratodon purpureus]
MAGPGAGAAAARLPWLPNLTSKLQDIWKQATKSEGRPRTEHAGSGENGREDDGSRFFDANSKLQSSIAHSAFALQVLRPAFLQRLHLGDQSVMLLLSLRVPLCTNELKFHHMCGLCLDIPEAPLMHFTDFQECKTRYGGVAKEPFMCANGTQMGFVAL